MRLFKEILFFLYISFFCISCGESQEKRAIPLGKPEDKPQSLKQIPRERKEIILSFSPVIKKIAPAVVNIYAIRHADLDLSKFTLMNDPFFGKFFDRFDGKDDPDREDLSLGSGVIVSKEGLILTNYHVIKGAGIIQVALADQREFKAKIILTDKKTDLVLLKIEGNGDFPFLTVEPPEDLEVGDLVLAIGNPFGIGQTVTNGIISALTHTQKGINDFNTFIQTDAAINPGNSGGPLITTDGRLIGINTAIYSENGGSVGIGFAIPIALAIPILESATKEGEIPHPWIGLDVEFVSPESVKTLGFSNHYGVFVKSVYPKGPAADAGIRAGDFITALNGHKIADDISFDYRVATAPLKRITEVTLLRKGEKLNLPVFLIESKGRGEGRT